MLPRTVPFRPQVLDSKPSIVVAARLGPALLTRFRIVTGREYRLIEADSWNALRDVVRASPTQVAVVDPCIDGSDDAAMATLAGFGSASRSSGHRGWKRRCLPLF